MLTVLAIDDDPQNLGRIASALENAPIELLTTTDPVAGLELFARRRPACVLVDGSMPNLTGEELLQRIVALDPGVDVILMSAQYSSELAVSAIQKGASDYLAKPLDLNTLRSKIQALADEAEKRRHALELDHDALHTFQFQGIVGRSPLMLDMFATIQRVAPHFRTVLVHGETGTGKELVATALHNLGQAANAKFAVCNCSAITESLVESELFGYVRGAFTGATQDKPGLFEYADGGTVFLDEIGELPLAAQAKLLRVLQNQQIQRVGSPVTRNVNVRVVAATNRNLKQEVAEKRFRADLYYRLSMIAIEVPPLRRRVEDLPLLQRFLIQKFNQQYGKTIRGMTRRTQSLIARYPWPGNVRELENAIGSACMMAAGDIIDVDDMPADIGTVTSAEPAGEPLPLSLDEVQMRHIAHVMKLVEGNKGRAAEILHISRGTLYNWLNRMQSSPKKGEEN